MKQLTGATSHYLHSCLQLSFQGEKRKNRKFSRNCTADRMCVKSPRPRLRPRPPIRTAYICVGGKRTITS